MLGILYSKFYLTHDETKMHNYIYIHTAIYINIMYIVVVFLEKVRWGPSSARSCRLLPLSSSLVRCSSGSLSMVSASSLNSDLVETKTFLMSLYRNLLCFQLVNAGDVHKA